MRLSVLYMSYSSVVSKSIMLCWLCGYSNGIINFPITYSTIFTAYGAVIDSNDDAICGVSTEIQSDSSIYIRTTYNKTPYKKQVYALVIGS